MALLNEPLYEPSFETRHNESEMRSSDPANQPSPHKYTISPAKRLYYPYPQAKCRNHCRDLPAHCTPPNGASTAPLTRTIYFVQRSSPQPGFSILFLVGSVLHRLTKYLPSMSPLPHPPYNQQPTQQRKPLNAQPFHLISSHLI